MAVGIFAGIAVRDYKSALDWYRRLLGADPTSTKDSGRVQCRVATLHHRDPTGVRGQHDGSTTRLRGRQIA